MTTSFEIDYQSGQTAFERGDYRQAIAFFMSAIAQTQATSKIGGEIQIWLAMAYEAAGQVSEAKALCQKLSGHPSLDTRQTSKRMLYIMDAPELARRDDWLTKIPDLSHLEDREGKAGGTSAPSQPLTPKKEQTLEERYPPIDLSQVNTQDNNFIAIALGFTAIVLLGLWSIGR
jgi:tetratricopeptide (TPR) repeat protein